MIARVSLGSEHLMKDAPYSYGKGMSTSGGHRCGPLSRKLLASFSVPVWHPLLSFLGTYGPCILLPYRLSFMISPLSSTALKGARPSDFPLPSVPSISLTHPQTFFPFRILLMTTEKQAGNNKYGKLCS